MFITTLSFPGIVQFESVSATLNHGITPGSIVCQIAPQNVTSIQLNGNFTINYSDGTTTNTITFADCNVDSSSFSYNSSGQVISLVIKDFRWKWQFGTITGEYNIRTDDGEFRVINGASPSSTDAIGNSEKTPRQLATLCLEAMGVSSSDVTDLPNDPRPRISWDYANPAQELQTLVDSLGCDVVPRLDGSVKLCKRGNGASLPSGPIESQSSVLNPLDKPKQLVIVSSPTRLQIDFDLEAVGLDKDGTIKPIAELSYAPSHWATPSQPIDINDLARSNPEAYDIATASVLKWYRIKKPTLSSGLPFGTIQYVEQFELLNELIETAEIGDGKEARPAFVYGKWLRSDLFWTGNVVANLSDINQTQIDTNFKRTVLDNFSIDPQRQLVKFNQPVRLTSTMGVLRPAELRLRTSCFVRLLAAGGFVRYERDRDVYTGSPAKNRVVVQSELKPHYIVHGNSPGNNMTAINQEADYYLDELMTEYDITEAETATYGGIIPVTLDGAIKSATWTFNSSGATTVIDRNDDPGNAYTPAYKVRKRQAKLTRAANAIAKSI